jgi:hypothetical protein
MSKQKLYVSCLRNDENLPKGLAETEEKLLHLVMGL